MGFEENGGGFFPTHIPTPDGGMTTAVMLEVIAARGAPLSKLIAAAFPKFYQTKTKVPIDPSRIREIMRKIERQGDGKVEKVDGVNGSGRREDVGANPPQRHRANRHGLGGVRDEGEG